MELLQYSPLACRTARLMEPKLDMAHAVLGLVSEIAELREAVVFRDREKILDEAGDIMWYWNLAVLSLEADIGQLDASVKIIRTDDNRSLMDAVDTLYTFAATLSDVSKKRLITDRVDDVRRMKALNALGCILYNILQILFKCQYDLRECLRFNIDKLSARYPDLKFEVERCLNHGGATV